MADPQGKSGPPLTGLVDSPDVEENMSIGRYIATRIPTLVPPMRKAPNPFKALAMLNRQQWLFFWVSSSTSKFMNHSMIAILIPIRLLGRVFRLELGRL